MSPRLAPYRPGAAPRRLRAEQVAVFTDLHLSPARPQEIAAFAESLQALDAEVEALVILGDLFDAYLGREDLALPAYQPLWEVLARRHRRGLANFLLRGNRDVLMTAADGRRVHLEVSDSLLLEGAAGRVLMTHGDAFCRADLPYQRLRRLLRNPLLRPLLRALPWRWRQALAARLRRHSTLEVARKPLDMMLLHRPTAAAEAARWGAGELLIGHLHHEQRESLGEGRFLTVLPAWEPGRAAVDPWRLGA